MKLCVSEIKTQTTQAITIGNRSLQLIAIRPHIYRHNSPAGSLTVQIQDSPGKVIGTSDTILISSIGSNTYWHGYQRFLISTQLKAFQTYTIAVVASGYTFSNSAYVGWCTDFDFRKVPALYTPNAGVNAPLDMEVWEMREQIRRTG